MVDVHGDDLELVLDTVFLDILSGVDVLLAS